MPRYKRLFKEMLEQNSALFSEFEILHNAKPRDLKEFNRIGELVMDLIRQYIDDLCRTSEGSGYGSTTQNLSDKFMNEVRSKFPDIDDIGIE